MTVVPEGRKLLRREVRNAETLAAGRSCLRHEGLLMRMCLIHGHGSR